MRVLGADARSSPAISCASLPNHSCVVSNLVDAVWLVNGDDGVDRAADVSARGRIA